MASKRLLRRKSCDGKRVYSNQTEAVAVLIVMKKKLQDFQLHTYRCQFGKHWHIGHMPVKF